MEWKLIVTVLKALKCQMMKIKKIALLTTLLMLIMVLLQLGFTPNKTQMIDGAWSVIEVQNIKSDGTTSTIYPKESKAIFAGKDYSFCWTSHTTIERSWSMTDSIKLNRFNQSIVNTGTFDLKDGVLTTQASFAMNPMFVNGIATFKCSFHGDTLVLRGLNVVSSDNIVHPVYANNSFIVSKLLRLKKH